MKDVLVIMGSKSDLEVMAKCHEMLDKFELTYDIEVASAHRNPERVAGIARQAKDNYRVVIAAAGKAAHLPGVFAGQTTLPVIGVPIKTSDLGGLDSLYSIVQMPSGVPVACVAINGAANAAILAAQIIGVSNLKMAKKIEAYKQELTQG